MADETRLRLIDLLTAGDLAPVEAQRALGVPSNLLAHHVKVLEQAGLIARSRSEADRRRTYLHLVPGASPTREAAVAKHAHAPRVVFVCTANSARSQLAAELWSSASPVPSTSAGTHPAAAADTRAAAVAERHGFSFQLAQPRRLQDVLTDGDLIITVCDTAHEELGSRSRLHWSVPDPVRIGTDAAFDAAFEEIARRVGDLAPRIDAC